MLLQNPDWRGLIRYAGSFDQEPLTYVQSILSHVRDADPDVGQQLNGHARVSRSRSQALG